LERRICCAQKTEKAVKARQNLGQGHSIPCAHVAEVLYLQKLPKFLVVCKQHLRPNANATGAAWQKEHAFPDFF